MVAAAILHNAQTERSGEKEETDGVVSHAGQLYGLKCSSVVLIRVEACLYPTDAKRTFFNFLEMVDLTFKTIQAHNNVIT